MYRTVFYDTEQVFNLVLVKQYKRVIYIYISEYLTTDVICSCESETLK